MCFSWDAKLQAAATIYAELANYPEDMAWKEAALAVENLCAALVAQHHRASPSDTKPYTERLRTVLRFAEEEAAALGHKTLGTQHLLLGLLREGEGIAVAIMCRLNWVVGETDLDAARDLVRELCGARHEEAEVVFSDGA